MPLVRIDLPRTIEPERRNLIGDIVYRAMADVLNVPDGDKFQIITAHDADALRIDPTYLGIERSAPLSSSISRSTPAHRGVETTVLRDPRRAAHGRSQGSPAGRDDRANEVAKENWSFGNGEAQYT